MSNIVFMPTYSRCGTTLYNTTIDAMRPGSDSIGARVYPPSCPVCKAPFDQVIMPFALPFDAPGPKGPSMLNNYTNKELIDI